MIKNLLASSVVLILVATADAEIIAFSAVIDGAQALDCAGTGSAGTGSGTFTLDTVTNMVTFNIEFSGMTGAETVAHVHGPALACSSAPQVYALPAGSPKIGSAPIVASAAQDMLAGLHFVNIHSTFEGSGEIRGQIGLAPIPTVSEWGVNVMVLLMLTAGTLVYTRHRPYHA